nr:uncharacterized protein LOC128702933 [Cherax quadricarinatus]
MSRSLNGATSLLNSSRKGVSLPRTIKISVSKGKNEMKCCHKSHESELKIINQRGHRTFKVYTCKKKAEQANYDWNKRRIVISTKKPSKASGKRNGRVTYDSLETCRMPDCRLESPQIAARDGVTRHVKGYEVTQRKLSGRSAVGLQSYDSRKQISTTNKEEFVIRSLSNGRRIGKTFRTYERWGNTGIKQYKGKKDQGSLVNEIMKEGIKLRKEFDRAKRRKETKMKEKKHFTEKRMEKPNHDRLVMQEVRQNRGTDHSSEEAYEKLIGQVIKHKRRTQHSPKTALDRHEIKGMKQPHREPEGFFMANMKRSSEIKRMQSLTNERTGIQRVKYRRGSKNTGKIEGKLELKGTQQERGRRDTERKSKERRVTQGIKLCKGIQTTPAQINEREVRLCITSNKPVRMTRTVRNERVLVRDDDNADGIIPLKVEGSGNEIAMKGSTNKTRVNNRSKCSANNGLVLKDKETECERIMRNEDSANDRPVVRGEASGNKTIIVKELDQSQVANKNWPIIIPGKCEQGVVSGTAPDGTPYSIKLNLAGLVNVRPTIVIISTGKDLFKLLIDMSRLQIDISSL